MTAEIITIGTELLDGTLANGNARRLGRALTGLGVEVLRVTTVPDQAAASRASLT